MFRSTASSFSRKYRPNLAPGLHSFAFSQHPRNYSTSDDSSDNKNGASDNNSTPRRSPLFSRRNAQRDNNNNTTNNQRQSQNSSDQQNAPRKSSLFSRRSSSSNQSVNRISQGGSNRIRMFDEQNKGRRINEPGKADKPAYTGGTGEGGVPTNAYVERRSRPLFGRPRPPGQKPPRAGSVHADLNRDDKKALRTPFKTDSAGNSEKRSTDLGTPAEEPRRSSLFGKSGLFSRSRGRTSGSPLKDAQPAGTAEKAEDRSVDSSSRRRPLFSSVASPFAKPATGPRAEARPADAIPRDPKSPVRPQRGIPKTSMYGIEHDERVKREVERNNLLRERTQAQLKNLAVRANVRPRHRFWENLETEDIRVDILKRYNEQRYDMLKPLLDLVNEVDELEQQQGGQSEEIDSLELQSIDDEVNGFLNKNRQVKNLMASRLNPWNLIEDPKFFQSTLTKKAMRMNGYELFNKLDNEIQNDKAAARSLSNLMDLESVRADKQDYEAYELAVRLIQTNVPDQDVAKDEWQLLKEDMAKVLNLDPKDMQSQRLLTSDPLAGSEFSQKPIDPLQDQAKSFVEGLKQSQSNEGISALEAFKIHQQEEESLIKALKSRDKVALLADAHGGTLIGLNNHILVYEAQMRQIIRDHNRRLRLLRDARKKYAKQYERVEFADTAPLMHITKYKGKQIQAPLYKYVEKFVDRIPESVAKRRLASHSRVIMRNKYLTLEEKKVMVGNLAQVYHKYRLHLHMDEAKPRPNNLTHIHNEISRVGGI